MQLQSPCSEPQVAWLIFIKEDATGVEVFRSLPSGCGDKTHPYNDGKEPQSTK